MKASLKEIMEEQYRKARLTIYAMYLASALVLVLPLLYEASIGFVHVRQLENLSPASVYIILIFLSGFCLGSATFYRKVIKRMEGMF
jgi:hypothetical protein